MEPTIEQALQQGVTAHKEGKIEEAERLYRAILQSQPEHPDANHNLGVLAVSVNKADAALPLFKIALEANPKIEQFWLSYIDALIKEKQFDNAKQVFEQAKQQGVDADRLNSLEAQLSPKTQIENVNSASPSQQQLSNLLEHYQAGRLDDAEKLATSISQEFPKHQFAWKVLGAVLEATGRKSEAVEANQTAVALSPQDAEAHSNLGNTLKELGRLDEALASYTQAIALEPDLAEAHSNLGIIFAINGDYGSALNTMEKAHNIEPKSRKFILLLSILKSRQSHSNNGTLLGGLGDSIFNMRLTSNPQILHREVEPELVANLYDIDTKELDKTIDARFGNGITTDWVLFENYRFIMENVKGDLINIIKKVVKSDIYVEDSFFNILGAGSGSAPHNHINALDKTNGLNLYKQKYVLQYYLRVGDQNCSEPGIYKVYSPYEEILPSEGMIIIIPAERMHSAVYDGDEDRVMIGINFYAL